MKWARFCLFIYGAVALAIIARSALADANECKTRVTGGRTAQAVVHCSPDDCGDTGFCESWLEDTYDVDFYMYFPGHGWRGYGGGEGTIEYCACTAWGGDPPQRYMDGANPCCHAVAFRPPSGGSWVGTRGGCYDVSCPAGECGIEEDMQGVVTGECQ